MDPFLTRIDPIDLGIIGLYILFVFAIGAYFARRAHDADDLFIKPLQPNLTSRQTVWIGRIAILFFMMISGAVAPWIGVSRGSSAICRPRCPIWCLRSRRSCCWVRFGRDQAQWPRLRPCSELIPCPSCSSS
jgi:hypothetical protein